MKRQTVIFKPLQFYSVNVCRSEIMTFDRWMILNLSFTVIHLKRIFIQIHNFSHYQNIVEIFYCSPPLVQQEARPDLVF